MLRRLKSKLCCQSGSYEVHLLLELIHSKSSNSIQRGESTTHTRNNEYVNSSISMLNPFDYCFYVFIDFNYGTINEDQDFLYICKDEVPSKATHRQLSPNYIIPIETNQFNTSSGHCHFSLQRVDLFQTYKICYMRRNNQTDEVEVLSSTKKFKVALKNKIHNLYLDSILDNNNQGLAVYYEDDHFFDKISQKKTPKTHRKNVSMFPLNDTTVTSASGKILSSYRGSRYEERVFQRIDKSSIYTLGSSTADSHIQPSMSFTNSNKESFIGYPQQYATTPGIATRTKNASVGNIQDMAKRLFSENTRVPSKEGYDYVANHENDTCNDSVIINENKDNDEYIKKLCAVLSENLESNANSCSLIDRDPLANTFGEKDLVRAVKPPLPIKGYAKNAVSSLKQNSTETALNSRRLIDFSQVQMITSNVTVRSTGKTKEQFIGRGENCLFGLKGSLELSPIPRLVFETRQVMNSKEFANSNVMERRRGQEFLSPSFISNEKSTLTRQSREGNLEQSSEKSLDVTKSNRQSSNKKTEMSREEDFVDSEEVEELSNNSVVILDSIPEEEQSEPQHSGDQAGFKIEKTDFEKLRLDVEDQFNKAVFQGESESKETPRYSDIDFRTHYTPGYSERLYTVEEVCSPSKESSNGGELQFKTMNSGTVSNRYITNSTRCHNEKYTRSDQVEGYEVKSLDFENLSVSVTQNSLKEMPLEVMILRQKVENLGLKFEYLHSECLICIQERYNRNKKYFFKWYRETTDEDLYQYFDEVFQNIKQITLKNSLRG